MYIIFVLIILFFGGTFVYAGKIGAPWIATRPHDVERVLSLAKIQPNQHFYDLGCGDARLITAAAKAGALARGFEISLLPLVFAWIRLLLTNNKNCRISYKNFWRVNLGEADIIYFFLMPQHFPKLTKKFMQELKPGTKIISYVWPIPEWTSIKEDRTKNQPAIYLYQIEATNQNKRGIY